MKLFWHTGYIGSLSHWGLHQIDISDDKLANVPFRLDDDGILHYWPYDVMR